MTSYAGVTTCAATRDADVRRRAPRPGGGEPVAARMAVAAQMLERAIFCKLSCLRPEGGEAPPGRGRGRGLLRVRLDGGSAAPECIVDIDDIISRSTISSICVSNIVSIRIIMNISMSRTIDVIISQAPIPEGERGRGRGRERERVRERKREREGEREASESSLGFLRSPRRPCQEVSFSLGLLWILSARGQTTNRQHNKTITQQLFTQLNN